MLSSLHPATGYQLWDKLCLQSAEEQTRKCECIFFLLDYGVIIVCVLGENCRMCALWLQRLFRMTIVHLPSHSAPVATNIIMNSWLFLLGIS